MNRIGLEVSKMITELLIELGVEEKMGFCLFLTDFTDGIVQYNSDVDPEVSRDLITEWLKVRLH